MTDYPVKDASGNVILDRDIPKGSSIPKTAPAEDFYEVVPSDAYDLPNGICRALWIGTSGDITCLNKNGDAVTLASVPIGVLPVRTTRVKATGTTADNIVALY